MEEKFRILVIGTQMQPSGFANWLCEYVPYIAIDVVDVRKKSKLKWHLGELHDVIVVNMEKSDHPGSEAWSSTLDILRNEPTDCPMLFQTHAKAHELMLAQWNKSGMRYFTDESEGSLEDELVDIYLSYRLKNELGLSVV